MKTQREEFSLWQERLLERVGQCSCSIVSDERMQRVLRVIIRQIHSVVAVFYPRLVVEDYARRLSQ